MECVIVSDFNAPHIDWDSIMPLQPNSYEAGLIDVVGDLMLHQHVLTPTRIRLGQNASLLHLLLTKFPDTLSDVRVLPPLPKVTTYYCIRTFGCKVGPPRAPLLHFSSSTPWRKTWSGSTPDTSTGIHLVIF